MIIYLSLLDSREDHSKFTLLYNTYRHAMMHTAYSILNDQGLAEDAVHDAFVRAAKNFRKIGAVNSPQTKAFLIIITRNRIYKAKTRKLSRTVNWGPVTQ